MTAKEKRYSALQSFVHNSHRGQQEKILQFIIKTQLSDKQIKEVIDYFNIEVEK